MSSVAGGLEVARVGDDLRHPAEPGRGGQVGVGRHQHRHRAEARQRGDRDERAGPGLHQHADVGALPHADLDQAAHHIVDAAVDGLVGVHAAVEQQALPVGYVARLLGHDAAQRDPGVVVDLAEARQPAASVREVSTASVRADLLAATSASAAVRARLNAISVAAAAPCATRELSDTPLSLCSAGCSAIGETPSGMSPLPSIHFTHCATVGQVWRGGLGADDEAEMSGADAGIRRRRPSARPA